MKTWPRSGSAASCISSMAMKSAPSEIGIASTVQEKYRAPGGMIRSSPVTSAHARSPFWRTIRS